MKAATFLCVTVYGLQENLMNHLSCCLRIESLGLVVAYMVCLWDSLLRQLLQLISWSVERWQKSMNAVVLHSYTLNNVINNICNSDSSFVPQAFRRIAVAPQ